MKKIFNIALCTASVLTMAACNDFLETSSPSVVDSDFVFSNTVTARAALDGAYEQWRDCAQNCVFGDGLFYAADVAGSDIERHPEPFSNQLGRHYPECFYQNGNYAGSYGLTSYLKEDGIYANLYSVISKANAVITSMENAENFEEIMSSGQSELGQMYGEAVAMRATAYRELCKNFGDVPYVGEFGITPKGLTGRDSIYDVCIAQLQEVEPLMYPVGSIPGITTKNYFSKTYVQGLIGRMCLDAGGYQTRRNDVARVDGNGNPLTFETKGSDNNNATYGRRTDWQNLYNIAKKYFAEVLANSGTAVFYTTDPRGASDTSGRTYNNPYQYFFEQMHLDDAAYADESIYEYPMQQGSKGGNDGRPYSFGRPSSGGSKNAFPCKSYGQGRINPAYYYGKFDPEDMRRDVSITVTGSDGKGNEKLIPFTPNSKADGGGLSLSKWDENRQTTPYVAGQRHSGINGPYMRMAEMYLGYAEVCAALGETGTALQYLKIVRERSFPEGEANTEAFVASWGGDMVRAIVEERGYEFAGEGDRRWTLIRSGYVGEVIMDIKNLTTQMMNGLASQGYYTFENGNQISLYVWTKMVDAKKEYGYRLTAQCPTDKEDDPVLYPGWRGQKDDWENYGCAYSDTKTNLAIQGLFKHIEPGSAEAKALEADGYEKVEWGQALLDNRTEYEQYLFWDYDGVKAPIYLWPFTPNVLSAGGFTNGYGFRQE